LLYGMCLCMGGIFLTGAKQKENSPIQDLVKTQRLELVDSDGDLLAVLGEASSGGGLLQIYGSGGSVNLLFSSAQGMSVLQISDHHQNWRVSMSAFDGFGQVAINGPGKEIQGTMMASMMGSMQWGGGRYETFNPSGKRTIMLGTASNEAGAIIANDREGKTFWHVP